jgi:hypothetical protein
MNRAGYTEKYESWWKGKLCRPAGTRKHFKRVKCVVVIGPPSFVHGDAWLVYEDDTEDAVRQGDAFRPRKKDIEVKEEHE